MISLDKLSLKQRAVISCLENVEEGLMKKLVAMGIVEGAEVQVLRYSPLGDPLTVKAFSYVLSLRRSEARAITVTPCE